MLDLYLVRTVAMTMLMAVLGLLGILTIFTFIEQVEDMRNAYGIREVLMFCLYSMPRMFYEVVPYSALIGCLAGLGILANNSELVVMRSSGVSTWSIAWSAMKPALALVLLSLFVGEYVLPDVERVARDERTRALSDESQITSLFGYWYREGNVYLHFEEIGGNALGGVSHYYFDDDNNLERTLYAERAVFHDVREDEQYWLLEKVIITDIGPDATDRRIRSSLRWDSGLTPELLSTEILVQPDKMSISQLSDKIEYMRGQGLNSGKFEIGYWQKVLMPVATAGLVFVAISFIFGPLRESTMGMRVVSGLIVGIMFRFVQNLLTPASLVYGFPPLIAILVPILICIGIGYLLLRRAS